jgi:hypothetical protein
MVELGAAPARDSLKVAGKGGTVAGARAGFPARAWRHVKESFSTKPIPDAIPDALGELWQLGFEECESSPSATLLKHLLYKSQSQYVKSFLKGGDDHAGFLSAQLSTAWQMHLGAFDTDSTGLEAQANAAGVPLAAVFVPNRAQATMISMGEWPARYDPYRIGEELRRIITSHGGAYIDILPDFRAIPNPEQYYFPVDGHPDAEGHAIIAGMLARELTSGAIPELKAAAPPKTEQEQGR